MKVMALWKGYCLVDGTVMRTGKIQMIKKQ